jgi:hypothetical protein
MKQKKRNHRTGQLAVNVAFAHYHHRHHHHSKTKQTEQTQRVTQTNACENG